MATPVIDVGVVAAYVTTADDAPREMTAVPELGKLAVDATLITDDDVFHASERDELNVATGSMEN